MMNERRDRGLDAVGLSLRIASNYRRKKNQLLIPALNKHIDG